MTIDLSQLKIAQLRSKNKLTFELEHFFELKDKPLADFKHWEKTQASDVERKACLVID